MLTVLHSPNLTQNSGTMVLYTCTCIKYGIYIMKICVLLNLSFLKVYTRIVAVTLLIF